jgi:hypothetical protein
VTPYRLVDVHQRFGGRTASIFRVENKLNTEKNHLFVIRLLVNRDPNLTMFIVPGLNDSVVVQKISEPPNALNVGEPCLYVLKYKLQFLVTRGLEGESKYGVRLKTHRRH